MCKLTTKYRNQVCALGRATATLEPIKEQWGMAVVSFAVRKLVDLRCY